MLVLSNGDLWIYSSKELEDDKSNRLSGVSKEIIMQVIPQHTPKEFFHIIFEPGKDYMPRRFIEEKGFWKYDFRTHELIHRYCKKCLDVEDILTAYFMDWGEVFVQYTGVDSGGYDAAYIIKIFPSVEEYNKAFTLIV